MLRQKRLLEHALKGLKAERQRIDEEIAEYALHYATLVAFTWTGILVLSARTKND